MNVNLSNFDRTLAYDLIAVSRNHILSDPKFDGLPDWPRTKQEAVWRHLGRAEGLAEAMSILESLGMS